MKRARRCPPRHPGFTLVELLTVVAVMAAIAPVVAVSLARGDEAAAWLSARWTYATVDAQARLAAQSEGQPIALFTERSGARLVARPMHATSGHRTATADLPAGATLNLLDGRSGASESLSALWIDRAGRSVDAIVKISIGREKAQRWHVNGLTGLMRQVDRRGGFE